MIDDNIHVAIRSFGRASRVTTLDIAPFAHVWVPESQADDYERHCPGRVVTIPDRLDGNLSRKTNAILDRTPREWTLILDDDITAIGYWEGGPRHTMTTAQFAAMIEHHFDLAAQLGVHLWGVNQNKDELVYRTQTPFSLLAPILGPFGGHIASTLRYDERMTLKDDYDFWLQHIRRYRKTLRANKYHYIHDHGKKPGGCVAQRTMDVERELARRMRRKWGRLYSLGGSKGGSQWIGPTPVGRLDLDGQERPTRSAAMTTTRRRQPGDGRGAG